MAENEPVNPNGCNSHVSRLTDDDKIAKFEEKFKAKFKSNTFSYCVQPRAIQSRSLGIILN